MAVSAEGGQSLKDGKLANEDRWLEERVGLSVLLLHFICMGSVWPLSTDLVASLEEGLSVHGKSRSHGWL